MAVALGVREKNEVHGHMEPYLTISTLLVAAPALSDEGTSNHFTQVHTTDIRTQARNLREGMVTLPDQAKLFWPTYNGNPAELGNFLDAPVALMAACDEDHDRITDANPKELLDRRFAQHKLAGTRSSL